MMRNKYLLVVLILAVAAFFRLQYFFDELLFFRIFSIIAGVLTVLGLYLLADKFFNWKIAAISSYLMAIAFWHVNFSRMAVTQIAVPLLLVWSLYFFWCGLSSGRILPFIISGIFFAKGIYVYSSFWIILLPILLTLLAYWHAIKKDFEHEKYIHIRNQMTKGVAFFTVSLIAVALPKIFEFMANSAPWNLGQNSIFTSPEPLKAFFVNIMKIFGMFNFTGDTNWLHNISGQPILLWPVGVLFAVGLLRSFVKLFGMRGKHGHFATIPTLLLSWFFIGLLPQAFYAKGVPDSLQALIVAPVVFIFAGESLWWLIDKLGDWWHMRDVHEFSIRHQWLKESSIVAVFALVILLFSFTVVEYDKYFNKWAKDPHTIRAFQQNSMILK